MSPFWSSKPKVPLVLVVEDDPGLRALLVELMDINGFETANASNGIDGLAMAQAKAPQLILLDMIMPGQGGLETLKLLKFHAATRPIPVIMVTGEQRGKDVESAFGLGAVDYVIKPIRNDNLLQKIRKALGLPEEKK